MIKRLHDTIRSVDGYAGMAVEHDGTLVFSEGIEAAFAARLFAAAHCRFPESTVSIVIRGYTVTLFEANGLRVVCRLRGRFPPIPDLPEETTEYTTGEAASGLLARAEARKEAEAMLRMLLEQG